MNNRECIYIGSIDDKVEEFPWAYYNRELFPIEQILKNFLIGREIYVTDIHLILNEFCRMDLRKKEESILFGMMRAGILRVPRRENSLSQLVKIQKDAGIISFNELEPEDIELFHWLDEQLPNDKLGPKAPESSVVWDGFHALANMFFDLVPNPFSFSQDMLSDDDWYDVINTYNSLASETKVPSRKEYEAAVDAMLIKRNLYPKEITFIKRILMNFGNQVFHMNYSSLLSYKYNKTVLVETAALNSTLSMFDTSEINNPFNGINKLINIQDIYSIWNLENIGLLTSKHHPLGVARKDFIDAFIYFGNGNISVKEVTDIGCKYSDALKKHVKQPRKHSFINSSIDLCYCGISTAIGALSGFSPLGTAAIGGCFWVTSQITQFSLTGKIVRFMGNLSSNLKFKNEFNSLSLSAPINPNLIKNHNVIVKKM